MKELNEQDVLVVIQKALNVKAGRITLDSKVGEVEEWDSLGHLGILAALDEMFGGKVAGIKEMAGADSVRKIVQLLKDNSLI